MKRILFLSLVLVSIVLLAAGVLYAQKQNRTTDQTTTGGFITSHIVAGINPAALDGVDSYDTAAPPPPPNHYLYEYFLLDPGSFLPNYSVDIRKDDAGLATKAKEWNLRAVSDSSGSLPLNLPSAASLPGGFKPVLYDLATGAYQNLRSNPSYSYTASSGVTASFKILMGDSTNPAVSVTYPNGGEQLVVGSPVNITWTSTDASGILSQDLLYSLDGTNYLPIATVNGSVHSYSWTPASGSGIARIKVVAKDSVLNIQESVSSSAFDIGYTITASAGSGGSITPPGVTTVNYNGSQAYTITHNPGYHVADVLVNSVSVGAATNYTFTNVTAHQTIAASFAIDQHTVTFDANTGTGSLGPQTANYGVSTALLSNTFTKIGYQFSGWNTQADGGGTAYLNGAIYNFTADITLYARWAIIQYTISFESNSGTPVGSITQDFGTPVIAPAAPTRTGYTFTGWYSDIGLTTPYVFSTMPASNITLYAKWTANQYTISFESNGGSSVGSITQDYGSTVSAPTAPTKAGYTFTAWYSDIDLTTPYVFTTMPASNILLYAKWTVIQYTISFESNGGSPVGSIIQDFGTPVSPPAAPTRTGYTFAGWYSDIGLSTPYVFSTMPASSIVLYAKWTINQFTLTYIAGTGGTITGTTPQTVNFGSSGTVVMAVANTWYHFVNWSDGVMTASRTETGVTANVTVTANFAPDTYTIHHNAIAGWNLVAVPVPQAIMTPAGIFGDDYGATPYYVFQFNPEVGYSVPSVMNQGQGYWLGSNSAVTVNATGSPLSGLTLLLANGFNIIGNPFVTEVPKADLRFTDGSQILTLEQANSAGWLSNVLYKYTGTGYLFADTTLEIWKGYWIPMLKENISVIYTAVVGPPAPKASGPAPEQITKTNWSVELQATYVTAEGETWTDRVASFGVRSDATPAYDCRYDAPRPPRSPASGYVEIGFPVGGNGYPALLGADYARVFTSPDKAQWEFAVKTSAKGTVTLHWDRSSIGTLGSDVPIRLCDAELHKTVDMKAVDSYTYQQTGTSHRFSVRNPDALVPASFVLTQNYPNPFNPTTTVRFGLPQDSRVVVTIYDALGRKVLDVIDGTMDAGYHDVAVNGAGLSSGMYICRINVVTQDGRQFTSQNKMVLVR